MASSFLTEEGQEQIRIINVTEGLKSPQTKQTYRLAFEHFLKVTVKNDVANLEIVGLSIGAFVATNIDDLFIPIVFFAKRSFSTSQIILGQYVGMGLLPA